MADLRFDATNVKPAEGFDTIPAGWYKAIIDESEIRPTKDGTGLRLHLRFMVIEGPCQGRKVFEGLNIKNNSEKAQEIAIGQLSAICHAVGILQVGDSQELHNRPMFIKVKITKDPNGQYEDKNEINTWKPLSDPVATAATSGSAAPQANGGWASAAMPPTAVQPGPGSWQAPAAAQPWQQPAAAPAPAPAGPGAAPAGWTPPGAPAGAQPWQHQPPAAGPAAAAPPVQPPHPSQQPPPWQQPAAQVQPQAQPGPAATGVKAPWQQ